MDEFESLFQLWLAEGGLAKPCVREDLEREDREQGSFLKKSTKPCPHGKTPLTCNECYFSTNG